jgi:hypothetical protein
VNPYTLFVLSEPLGSEVLLAAQHADGTLAEPTVATDAASIQAFFAHKTLPVQIAANASAGVRLVREAEPRLFRVPATVLKPKELLVPLLSLVFRAHAR